MLYVYSWYPNHFERDLRSGVNPSFVLDIASRKGVGESGMNGCPYALFWKAGKALHFHVSCIDMHVSNAEQASMEALEMQSRIRARHGYRAYCRISLKLRSEQRLKGEDEDL